METVKGLKAENALLRQEILELMQVGKTAKTDFDIQEVFRESQTRFRTIFEASRLGNKIISSDLSILQVNMSMVRLLGYDTKEEIIGTKILDYAPKESHKDWIFLQEKLWHLATPSFSIETCLLKKDGSLMHCQVTSILFPDNGETLGYTIIEDVSERYELRKQREEFISIASHELRTPITSLGATVQLMNRMIRGIPSLPDRMIQLAENIERYTTKLKSLVDDLLNSTRIEQGQLILNKSKFKIAELINACCNHLRLEGKYHLTFIGDVQLEMFADEQKIDQVLVNLVNNAVKYAPDSFDITIEVRQMGEFIKVMVIDHGNGIPEENRAHLFDRYYRIDNDNQHKTGLGLGLYISSEIIKRHGGQIGLSSVVGEGATFWFSVPVPVAEIGKLIIN